MFRFLASLLFVTNVFAALPADVEAIWAKRHEKANMQASIAKFEELHAKAPQDVELMNYLARAYFQLGESFTEDNEEKKKLFDKSLGFAETAMRTNAQYKEMMDTKKDPMKAIPLLTVNEVQAIFWGAAALGKWSKANGVFSSLKYKDQILTMIRKVEELKPDFFYGAVPRFWGNYYAIAPGIAGGSMSKSKENFKKSLSLAPEFLGTKVAFAENYWVKEDDEKEFKKLLEEVIAAPTGPKEIEPENLIEKEKAKRLLAKMKDLF